MAYLHEIIDGIEDEVLAAIEGLEPRVKGNHPFRRRGEPEKQAGSLNDQAGRPRLAEFDRGTMVVQEHFAGKAVIRMDVIFDLRIAYPESSGWHAAAFGDFEQIREYFGTTSSSVDGVQMRVIDTLTPTIAKLEDDPWFIMTQKVRAHVEADV